MADESTDDNEFAKDLAAAFAADEEAANSTTPQEPQVPADDSKKPEEPATPPADPAKEEPKKDEPAKPEDPKKPTAEGTAPASDEKKPEDANTPPKDPKAPATSEEPTTPQPLTKEDVSSVIRDIQVEERTTTRALEDTTKEVLDAYYPEGLSNVLIDQKSQKPLRTPADVVEASGGEMSTEEATQWLMNAQYKLDQEVKEIKDSARTIAETTVSFKRDSVAAVRKYEPLFKAYPKLQEKTFNLMMKQVKADEKKGVILAAPDVMDLYDTYLEPYQLAYEHATKQSATNSTPPDPNSPETPPTPIPGTDDRLDEGGDGGASPVDDPNDFAQQVNKELAKGI